MSTICRVSSVLAFVLVASTASAQYVANPKSVEFFPSADHNVTLPTTPPTPMVLRYELRFYLEGASQPVQTGDLGKPNPGTDGLVRASIQNVVASLPFDTQKVYRAKVVAIGGVSGIQEALSADSNPFGAVGPVAAVTGVVLKP